MAKFQFRMTSLLRVRESLRDQRRGELAAAFRADEVLQQRLQHVRQELTWLLEQCRRAAGPGTVDVDRLIESQRYDLTLRAMQKQIEDQRRALAAEIERRRGALVEADREVRTLEKLRDRQREQYALDEGRRDVKRLDEVAQQRAIRGEVF